MDEISFDPRSWRKKEGQEPEVPAAKPQSEQTSLPEAWAGISTGSAAIGSSAPDARSVSRWAWRAATLILGLAALGAWSTRIETAAHPSSGPIAASAKASPENVERKIRLASPTDIPSALTTFGIGKSAVDEIAALLAGQSPAKGEIGMRAELSKVGQSLALDRLQLSYADGSGLVIERDAAGKFGALAVASQLTDTIRFLPGEIDTESFYSSAVSAGVPDTLVPEFINAFGYDFNLASEVAPGNTFEVAYRESVSSNGETVGQPELLYAKLTTTAKSLALYRFKRADGTVGWYDGNGATIKRGFMRTPVDGARITSKFGMRFHPTLHYNRLHAGVDFGVPIGTPVYAAAEGTVTGATPTGCGGNMAVVEHDNGWVTRYFHLSAYAPGLHAGQHVPQGFTLGLSGTTGSCTTGPHLHYELLVDGKHVDPLSIATDDAKRETLQGVDLSSFMQRRNLIDVARANQGI